MEYILYRTKEYDEWYSGEVVKSQVQIEKRLAKIEFDGYFGDHKSVGGYVWELKWKNGRRVYYTYIPEKSIVLLLGGNKNGQSKDIKKAKKILDDYTEESCT